MVRIVRMNIKILRHGPQTGTIRDSARHRVIEPGVVQKLGAALIATVMTPILNLLATISHPLS